MEYNNGVFLIVEPGYYRIIMHLRSRDNNLRYRIIKNSRENLILSGMPKWDSSSSYYVADLATFDMISVELVENRATVGVDSDSNMFQIEKIN